MVYLYQNDINVAKKWVKIGNKEELTVMVIQIDSRESNNLKIKEYFTKNNIEYFVSKLPCGDYANPQNMKIVIELKHSHNDGLGELVTNLCRSVNHQRFVNEINLAKKIGVEYFIILVASKDIN